MRHPARWALAVTAGLVLILLVAWLLPGGLELSITPVKGGAPLLVLPLQPGERFTLYYHHSVNHLPIWEEHSADQNGRIYIEEERFVSFNAGMGHWAGHGRHVMKNGYQVLEHIHMPVGSFVLRVGSPGVDHTILWRHTSTNLSRLVPGQAVLVAARPVSLLHRLWRAIFPNPATPSPGAANVPQQ